MPNEMTPQECAELIEILREQSAPEIDNDELIISNKGRQALQQSAAVMRKLATGEIAEVKDGHWKDYGDKIMCCTHCGFPAAYYPYRRKNGKEQNLSEFCPHCGALMDAKEDNNV